jgi:hypothetical protein
MRACSLDKRHIARRSSSKVVRAVGDELVELRIVAEDPSCSTPAAAILRADEAHHGEERVHRREGDVGRVRAARRQDRLAPRRQLVNSVFHSMTSSSTSK